MALCSGKQVGLEMVRFMAVIKNRKMIEHHSKQLEFSTESPCTSTTDASYLINCNIVTRLLKARGVVVPVPHHNPHLMENNRTDQLVGALDLHHNGHDVVRRLKESKQLYFNLFCFFYFCF